MTDDIIAEVWRDPQTGDTPEEFDLLAFLTSPIPVAEIRERLNLSHDGQARSARPVTAEVF